MGFAGCRRLERAVKRDVTHSRAKVWSPLGLLPGTVFPCNNSPCLHTREHTQAGVLNHPILGVVGTSLASDHGMRWFDYQHGHIFS